MTETGEIEVRSWIWVLLPWVAAAITVLAFAVLPHNDCSGSGPDGSRAPYVAIVGFAIALLVGGAVVRIVQLAVAPRGPSSREWFGLILCAALAAYYAVAYLSDANFGIDGGTEALVIIGFTLAPIVYALTAAVVIQKGADAFGVLVPISLLFVASMLVAPVAWFGFVIPEGGFC